MLYHAQVKTADVAKAGTDAYVELLLYSGGSTVRHILDSSDNDHEQDDERTYAFYGKSFGHLDQIGLRLVSRSYFEADERYNGDAWYGRSPEWLPQRVRVSSFDEDEYRMAMRNPLQYFVAQGRMLKPKWAYQSTMDRNDWIKPADDPNEGKAFWERGYMDKVGDFGKISRFAVHKQ